MFESNNKNNNENKVISQKKYCSGRSQFTRDKLQSDYRPKQRRFKAKLIKTQTDHNKILQKYQLDQQQSIIIEKAIQCFKNKEIIQIDWKTKSNFRKNPSLSLKLPRIQSEPISRIKTQIINNNNNNININNNNNNSNNNNNNNSKYSYKSQHKLNNNNQSRLLKSANKLDNICYQSIKQRSVSNKLTKLRQLILGSKDIKYHNQIQINQFQYNNTNSNSNSIKKNQVLNNKSINHHQSRNSNSNSKQTKQNHHQQIDFYKLRAKTSIIQPFNQNNIDNLDQIRSQRSNIIDKNRQNQDNLSQATSSINNVQINNKNQIKYEKYDILADPNVYFLISKSRQKIMTFKQQLSMSAMSPLQKISYLQYKRIQQKKLPQRINQSIISKSFSFKSRKQSVKQKFKQKGTSRHPQVSQFSQHKNSMKVGSYNFKLQDNESSFCFKQIKSEQSIDEGEQHRLQREQSKRKKKKNLSLLQVQQKLLKKVKLTFLKEDLANKFMQIREVQNSHRVRI